MSKNWRLRLGPQRRGIAVLCLEGLLSGPDAVIYFKDLESRFVVVSEATARKHRLTPGEMIGLTDAELFDSRHSEYALAEEQRIMTTGEATAFKLVHETWTDREDSWAITSKRPLRDHAGGIVGIVGISQDATQRVLAERRAERALAELQIVEGRLRTVLENSPDAILRVGSDLRFSLVNSAAESLLNRSQDELLGRTPQEADLEQAVSEPWLDVWRDLLKHGDGAVTELRIERGGRSVWLHCRMATERDSNGAAVSILTSARDITDLKLAEEAVAKQALTDSVTGLANRNLLTDRLDQALMRLERRPGHVALLFIDLDRFKYVNDTYGHHAGDQVLVEMARRLERVARRGDTVARLGGDEFVVLCDGIVDVNDVTAIAERVVRATSEPVALDGFSIELSSSVGVVVTDEPSAAPTDLIRRADAAMYRAKRGGRGAFRLWDAQLDESTEPTSGSLHAEIFGALERDELRLAFQPLLSLGDNRLNGFEALVRWHHPSRGLLPPAAFLAAAEAAGLMDRISTWVLDQAAAELAAWSAMSGVAPGSLTVSVNVSGLQLRAVGFAELVAETLSRHGVPACQLVLEVSEHALARDALDTDVREVLEDLTRIGVRLAVDDFGATYTSLARLPTFPVSIVKLDCLDGDIRAKGIAAAVVAMAHSLGMSVVGEGVETVAQLRNLVDLDVDDGQGFLLGRPLDSDAARALIERLQTSGPATPAP